MYVISIVCVAGNYGEAIPHEIQYATVDRAIGYPRFSSIENAKWFDFPEEAREWYEKNAKYYPHMVNIKHYDWSTLAITKVDFTPIEKLQMAEMK